MDPLSAALIKFATDLIQDQVKKKVGDAASGKVDDWIKQGDNARRLLEAFQAADDCFAEKCHDDKLKQAIRSAPLAALPSLEKIAASLPETLDDDLLSHALRQRFADDWRGQLSEAQLDRAASVYRDCLSVALAAKSDQLGIWTLLEVKAARRDIKEIPEAVAEELRRENLIASTLSALHSLPTPPADFTGREKEREQLLSSPATQYSSLIFGLTGMGGVGKTALALVAAHQLAPQFPDAQIFVDCRGNVTPPKPPTELMRQVIHAFTPTADLRQATDDEISAQYRNVLHDKRALILLDNAADAAQVKPLIPPPMCALLVTSRRRFALPGLRAIPLDVMPPTDARDLINKIAPRLEGVILSREAAKNLQATSEILRFAQDDNVQVVSVIARLCGYLPLALRVAASTLAVHEDLAPAKFIERLQQQRLKVLKSDDDPAGDVEAVLGTSYAMLAPEMQVCWRALSVFPAAFDAPAAASVWAIALDSAQDLLSDLVRLSLLNYATEDEGPKTDADICPPSSVLARYFLHDLLRDYADARLNDEERNTARLRHAQHYLQVARVADDFYERGGENILAGLKLFDAEFAHIQAGQAWATVNLERNEEAARLCSEYNNAAICCINLRLHVRERVTWLESAVFAARSLGDKQKESIHLGNLGLACLNVGDAHKAITYSEQALTISHAISDKHNQSAWLGNLGLAYAILGDTLKAIEYHEQALAIAREIGDKRSEGNHLGNLGVAHLDLGNVPKAIGYYEQAYLIAHGIGDKRGESSHLGKIGVAYYTLGNMPRAIEYYEQALTIARDIGDKLSEGSLLGNIGLMYRRVGKAHKAIEFYEQALAMAREDGDKHNEGAWLGDLGNAYSDINEVHKAIGYHQQSLRIAHEIGDKRSEGYCFGNLSIAYEKLGDIQKAIAFTQAALEIFVQIESPYAEQARQQLERLKAK